MNSLTSQRGLSLIETLLATALIGVWISTSAILAVKGLNIHNLSLLKLQRHTENSLWTIGNKTERSCSSALLGTGHTILICTGKAGDSGEKILFSR